MAAIVTGLIPILRTAVDTTTSYKCRSLWFGFLCIRLVILFLAELPFTKLDADFSCNCTRSSICVQACFNSHFHKPMVVAWNFIYVLFILSVLLMELFTSHLCSLSQKRSARAQKDVELESPGKGEGPGSPTDANTRMVVDLHKDRGTMTFYLFSVFLRIMVESWFLYVLLYWNLPALSGDSHPCSTILCSESNIVCVVRAAPEKRMSIYGLASISGMIIISSLIFCLYSIVRYIFRA